MISELQDHGNIGQDLGDWLSPRRSKPNHSLFSEEDK